jgi:hypothetical protein
MRVHRKSDLALLLLKELSTQLVLSTIYLVSTVSCMEIDGGEGRVLGLSLPLVLLYLYNFLFCRCFLIWQYFNACLGPWLSWLERCPDKAKVAGSNPAGPTR